MNIKEIQNKLSIISFRLGEYYGKNESNLKSKNLDVDVKNNLLYVIGQFGFDCITIS